MKMVPFHSLESSLINLSLDLECFFFSLVKYIILLIKQATVLHKYGAVPPFGIQLESNLTKLSLDLEWFVFSLVKFINLIIKQARVLQENGSVSPVVIKANQIKLGFRVVSFFACQIYYSYY